MKPPPPPWPGERPALRRAAFLLIGLLVAASLSAMLWHVLTPGGWTGWEMAIAVLYLGTLPWTAICVTNSLIGLALLLAKPDAPAFLVPQVASPPVGQPLRTAIAICIRNEVMETVLPTLARLLDGLEAAGEGGRFTLWFLSDTRDPAHVVAEDAAIAAFAAARAGGIPIRHRRRADNAGFKAGNVMEFLDHHAEGHDLALMLDADSEMSAGAVLRLVRGMEADPHLALIQQLIVGRPASSAFPRLFQFGMRAGMRAWATGQGWWQLDDGPYWGHNAIFRIAPFRAHARLAPLPDGSAILSHDQLEAVRLRAAGWRVRCLPAEDGSLEGNPPALPEFLARDVRWGAGNMQYRHLILAPGLRPMGRWQMAQAMLLFLCAPLWVGILLAALGNALTGGGAGTPMGAMAALLLLTWLGNAAPKLCGFAELLLRPERAAPYGGRAAVLRGAAAEILFSLLVEPVSLANKSLALARLTLGARNGWAPQNRADRGVEWGDAARLLWPHTLLGLGCAAGFAGVSAPALLLSLPFTAGLALAIPVCVWTASPTLSTWLRCRRIAATPEELAASGAAIPATSMAPAVPGAQDAPGHA
ncbi:glucans biosynthesis glucosyltransferase MdoH [Roseomonas xinghualingensis]|uniref:glucans biosynthesis glucosyltransferase MdoH n=1 Tax=Roseomonas xinghualingensis TaxID=2986475 RepID=UPI0021F1D241|nr:glucans biosynthesis glucosyltransferase MdoH [Roseomonas sp. SXEYE001]MCV4208429.1 glucans biosynthesis glucosyltransferase MdoH [Roseomonas sp. SXEYE001]